ncbi:hypothetical protein ACPF4F_000570, partial [Vibrio cholerae]
CVYAHWGHSVAANLLDWLDKTMSFIFSSNLSYSRGRFENCCDFDCISPSFAYIVARSVFGFRSLHDTDSVVIAIYDLYFRGDVAGTEFGYGG